MLMIKDFGNVSIDCQVNILIKYKKIWDKSRFRSSNLLALSIPKLGEVSHKARFESASQIDIGKLLPVNVITQYHASIIGNVPTRFRLAQTEEDMNNLILCFSVLVRVIALKTNQIRRQKDIIVMNSNESNKTNKRLLHRLIKPRHLNIPSNLVACFMGNCGPADESVVNLISESYCDQSDTSIGFPSSIFESRSNSWLCQLGLLRQPSEDENLFILHVNPTYEQDPLAFCQIFKPNVQEGAMVIYVDKRKKNVIEIECNIDGVESKLQTEVEIISSGQFKHRKKSILKKAGEKVSKKNVSKSDAGAYQNSNSNRFIASSAYSPVNQSHTTNFPKKSSYVHSVNLPPHEVPSSVVNNGNVSNSYSYQMPNISESGNFLNCPAGHKSTKCLDNSHKPSQWSIYCQNNNSPNSGVILDVLGALATVRRYCEANNLDLGLLQQLEKQIAVSELHKLSQ